VVNDVGPLGTVQSSDPGNRLRGTEEPIAATSPGERTQGEALIEDLLAVVSHPGCDDDLEAVIARGPGDREAM
jgi:hypothetical protein